MFAVGVFGCEKLVAKYEAENDDYSKIMAQALADRFAEAFAEALHREIRADIWGYSPDEMGKDVDAQELHKLHYQGIRPAPGYPSQPDHTQKRTMWDLAGRSQDWHRAFRRAGGTLPAQPHTCRFPTRN